MKDAIDIVLISDMHLSRERPFFQFNWEMTVERLNEKLPALVLVIGVLRWTVPIIRTTLHSRKSNSIVYPARG